MTKIGVISDTHKKEVDEDLKNVWEKYLKDVDIIVHAGDLTSIEILELFKDKRVYAIHGNMDDSTTKNSLPEKLVFTVENVKIGVVHGWGSPLGFPEKVLALFEKDDINCLIYGHTHMPKKKMVGNILTLNPGATFPGFFNRKGSIAYLFVEGNKAEAEIMEVKE
jgi:putative phosphoesterase